MGFLVHVRASNQKYTGVLDWPNDFL